MPFKNALFSMFICNNVHILWMICFSFHFSSKMTLTFKGHKRHFHPPVVRSPAHQASFLTRRYWPLSFFDSRRQFKRFAWDKKEKHTSTCLCAQYKHSPTPGPNPSAQSSHRTHKKTSVKGYRKQWPCSIDLHGNGSLIQSWILIECPHSSTEAK